MTTSPPTGIDRTMPALFGETSTRVDVAGPSYEPIAQLGAGSDGVAVLARSPDGKLVELRQLACLSSESARWAELRERLRLIAALRHPVVRAVVAIEEGDVSPTIVLEGDNGPILAELVEAGPVEGVRAAGIVGQLAHAIAHAHRLGIHHGNLHPLSIQLAQGDRPSIELTTARTFSDDEHPLARACRAPELAAEPIDGSSDVYALGMVLQLLTRAEKPEAPTLDVRRSASYSTPPPVGDAPAGAPPAGPSLTPVPRRTGTPPPVTPAPVIASLVEIIRATTQLDRDLRPTAQELSRRLADLADAASAITGDQDVPRAAAGLVLGRYELEAALGVGGMGEVWRAKDLATGVTVAIKVLKPEVARNPEVVRRFRKEARVLAAVESPHIANLLDVNSDRGLHYLVLELVAGGSVASTLKTGGRLPEDVALDIIGDACRALAEPHRRGIVHRDIKPENMMFVTAAGTDPGPDGQRIKLGDFGIARAAEAEPAAEDLTQHQTREGAVLGTPEYMSPEQCQGKAVTAATDVYALGASLYAMLVGKPPFLDETPMGVILKQLHDRPQRVDAIVPEISPATAALVERALEKDAGKRFADAADMLAALEGLRHGTPALITAHPAPPIHREGAVQTYTFEWELAASPEALWPFVSNTEKMNRAAKLAPVKFEVCGLEPGSSEVYGSQRAAGMALRWREHPYEWVEGSRHCVLRVFDKGVLRWYVAQVELERLPNGGTRLRNTVRLEPRGLLARIVSRWELGVRYKRNLDKVYRRLDGIIAGTERRGDIDPLQPQVEVTPETKTRIEKLGEELVTDGVVPAVADALISFLLHASDQDVARIRPLEIAHRLAQPPEQMIEACLRACQKGALVLLWDVVCPSCRIPSNVMESLQKISEHSHCQACNLDFAVDMSRAVELIFRVHPELRAVEVRTYCVGGPAHFPHVVAQVRLGPEERFALPLRLPAGRYQVKSPQLRGARDLRVSATGGVRRCDLVLGENADATVLTAGDQLLTLVNPQRRELLIRVERAGDREHALTAARAVTVSAFRALFPDQLLAPGRLLSVTQNVLLVAVLDDAPAVFRRLGDARAFDVALRWFDVVSGITREHGGTVVKTFGGLVLAAFSSAGAAVETALAIQPAIDGDAACAGLVGKIAVHQGAMMVLTVNGQLDYFGQNVELALDLPSHLAAGQLALTAPVVADARVQALVGGRDRREGSHHVAAVGRTVTTIVELPRRTAPVEATVSATHTRATLVVR
jgi:eukaryotic-like serine/threonine-protein kinase